MKIICPNCEKEFSTEGFYYKEEFYSDMYHILVYQDALKTNPNLKFICGSCGNKIIGKLTEKKCVDLLNQSLP